MKVIGRRCRPADLLGLLFVSTAMLGQAAHYSGAQVPLPSLATYATGIALDKSGDLFGVDNQYGTVNELTSDGEAYTAGNGRGMIAGLDYPWGIAADSAGNLYITEAGLEGPADVVKETVTATAYGNSYTPTAITVDGYAGPGAIAVDSAGRIYLASFNRVLMLTPAAGGYIQSSLPTRSTVYPSALAVDGAGNVYIADSFTSTVLRETPSGTAYVESTVVSQLPENPQSLTVDGSGSVYIDCYTGGGYAEDFFILKETPSQGGYRQSMVALAAGSDPWSIAVDASGVLYGGGSRGWEKLIPGAGVFAPVNAGANPYLNSTPAIVSLLFTMDGAVKLGKPAVLTQGTPGLDFKDDGLGTCTLAGDAQFQAGQWCSVGVEFYPRWAGLRLGAVVLQDEAGNALASGLVYGVGVAAQAAFLAPTRSVVKAGLVAPSGAAVDAEGNIFFAANASGLVFKAARNSNGYELTEVANGLDHPSALAIDGLGNLFVAADSVVYQEALVNGHYVQSEPISIAGQLNGIAQDGNGNLYITSAASGDVHTELRQPDGAYTAAASVGFGISGPAGVAVDAAGDVFVADPRRGEVWEERLAADGSYLQSVVADGLAEPQGLALDAGGSLYISATGSGVLYKETPQTSGSWIGSRFATDLAGPNGVAVDAAGNVYVSLSLAEEIDRFDVADPPVLNFAKTAVGATSADSPQRLTVVNVGNAAMYFGFYGPGLNPALSSGFAFDPATTCPVITPGTASSVPNQLNPGASCDYAIDFTPIMADLWRGSLGIEDNHLNALNAAAKQAAELREAGITSDLTRTSVRVSPSPVEQGLGVAVTVTVSDTSYAPTTPSGGGVTFTDTVSGKTLAVNGGTTVALTDGKATVNFVASVAGAHRIEAHYSGVDARFASSTGDALFTVRH